MPLIVGIGASAGGLEALERFLSHVPAPSGMGFIVIQHLGPNYEGIMLELLQRATPMKVVQARNGMKVEPECVYVIPPGKDLSILHGVLFVFDNVSPRGTHLPIDFFFRVLADDQREKAIGVVLSGMGSDGTLGVRALKEAGGLTLAQEPSSAKFNSMPRSAIETGMIDIIDAPEELPIKIVDCMHRFRPGVEAKTDVVSKTHNAMDQIIILLREHAGNDFSLYKKNTLVRRVERRMSIHQLTAVENYVQFLRQNPGELDLLFKELLIGVTSFFRDPATWEYLKQEVLPELLAEHPEGKSLRAWVVACSTGEEAYSLAMTFKEVLDELKPTVKFSLKIFSTDLDETAIARARRATYPPNIEADVSPSRLSRFFIEQSGGGYKLRQEIREMVTFAPQNVIMDPPFTKIDVLTCRNLLIYLRPQLQSKLLHLFHYALNPRGILLLGSAETVGECSFLFNTIDAKARIYRRADFPVRPPGFEFPQKILTSASFTQKEQPVAGPTDTLQHKAEQYLLENFSPVGVLVNGDGDILYISGRTGRYLEPAAGKANWNIYVMAREGIRYELGIALKKAMRQPEPVVLENVPIEAGEASGRTVNITVQQIEKPADLKGMIMIVFTEVAKTQAKKAKGVALNTAQLDDLEKAREEIQKLREEMQSSHEELTSANEEMQSVNEELQSTNEELTTSKEEMQSLNEELQTVNAELQSKVNDLSHINNDMKNLLNSTEIATIFLDDQFRIRRFTTQAATIFKLIDSDIGRPLSDIATDLIYPELKQDATSVLNSLAFSDKQIATNDERWFKVRIMPYRTVENMIDGVVITFSDITLAKQLEAKLRENIQSGR